MTDDQRAYEFKHGVLHLAERLGLEPAQIMGLGLSLFISFLFTQARDPEQASALARELFEDALAEGIRVADLVDPGGSPEKVLN